jgi:hypothetical protein
LADLEGDGSDEPMNAGFARAVGRLPGGSELAEHTADRDEPSRASQSHQRRVEHVVRAEQIRLHDAASLGAAPTTKSRLGRLACIRNDDIEPPPCLGRASHQGAAVRLVANIARKVTSLPARMRNFAYDLPERALVAATQHHTRSSSRQLESDGAADTSSTARDDGNLSLEKGLRHPAASSTLTEHSAPTIKRAVTGDTHRDELELRARLRGRRVGLGVVIVVAVTFVVASASQIVSAVFGLGTVPLAAGPVDSPERRCAEGIGHLVRTLAPRSGASPPATQALQAPWNDADRVEQECRNATGGLDAWDALLRLRAAELQLSEPTPADLQPLRNEVIAHLPADLR